MNVSILFLVYSPVQPSFLFIFTVMIPTENGFKIVVFLVAAELRKAFTLPYSFNLMAMLLPHSFWMLMLLLLLMPLLLVVRWIDKQKLNPLVDKVYIFMHFMQIETGWLRIIFSKWLLNIWIIIHSECSNSIPNLHKKPKWSPYQHLILAAGSYLTRGEYK